MRHVRRIANHAGLVAALARINALTDCKCGEDQDERAKLIYEIELYLRTIVGAMKTKIEQKPGEAARGAPTFSIETPEDHHLANERIKALQAGSRDEAAENELEALKQAVARWQRKPR